MAGYARAALSKVEGVKLRFSAPAFNEFVVETKKDPGVIAEKLLHENILFGIRLGGDYPELERCTLLTFTEMNSRQEITKLCRLLRDA